jgi:hypothetical protein
MAIASRWPHPPRRTDLLADPDSADTLFRTILALHFNHEIAENQWAKQTEAACCREFYG